MIKETYWDGDVRRDFTFTDDGQIETNVTQDVSAILKQNKILRDTEDVSVRKKSDFYKYASIPVVVVEELFKKGLSIFDNNDLKLIEREIELNYPFLKTTNAKGW